MMDPKIITHVASVVAQNKKDRVWVLARVQKASFKK